MQRIEISISPLSDSCKCNVVLKSFLLGKAIYLRKDWLYKPIAYKNKKVKNDVSLPPNRQTAIPIDIHVHLYLFLPRSLAHSLNFVAFGTKSYYFWIITSTFHPYEDVMIIWLQTESGFCCKENLMPIFAIPIAILIHQIYPRLNMSYV